MRTKPWEVSDGLWERIEPLLPRKPRRFRYPGRRPFDVACCGRDRWSRAIADSSHVQAKTGLGRERWVVERTFAWLHNRRRLLLRTDRHHETHEAFLSLACCLICWRRLESSSGRVPCPADQGVRASWTYVMWLGRSSCAR